MEKDCGKRGEKVLLFSFILAAILVTIVVNMF